MVPFLCALASLLLLHGQGVHASSCTENICIEQYGNLTGLMKVHWTKDKAATFLKGFYATKLGKCIKNQTIGNRPDVSCYLPETVIDFHLSDFITTGAAHIGAATYVAAADFEFIGYQDINWVTPYGTANGAKNMTTKCSEEPTVLKRAICVLEKLGEPLGPTNMFNKSYNQSNKVIMVKVDKDKLVQLDLRMASGNEEGANDEWLPGGYTSNDSGHHPGPNKEAIVSTIWIDQYCWYPMSNKYGNFCYPHCEIECPPSLPNCQKTACPRTNSTEENQTGFEFTVSDELVVAALGLSGFNVVITIGVVIWRRKENGQNGAYAQVEMDDLSENA